MLLMVVERFKAKDPKPISERFKRCGRMLPQGVVYHASWVDPADCRCFQLMEAADPGSLNEWVAAWNDLVDFEIIPVLSSNDYWASIDTA
jgi:hypothetical protein